MKTYEGYPLKVPICDCEKPTIKRWGYHLIGNPILKLLPGTSFTCKCGGYIDREVKISKRIRGRVEGFWAHPEDW